MTDFEKEAREILAPLFNQPHPFQEEWSPLHSMSLDDLHEKIAQALLRAHRQGQEEMREHAKAYYAGAMRHAAIYAANRGEIATTDIEARVSDSVESFIRSLPIEEDKIREGK